MAYTPVTRVVTVEFVKEKRGKGYEVRVTPELIVVRHGDKIVWDVQGLPKGLAEGLTFGGFELKGAVSRVSPAGKRLVPRTSGSFTRSASGVAANSRAVLRTNRAELGRYKYTIYFNGEPLIDPDGEIKGPRN